MILKLLVLYALLQPNLGKRILGFFPIAGKSQHNVFAPILHGLAVRGHHVVYLTSVSPDLSHPNLDVRLKQPFAKLYREKLDLKTFEEASPFMVQHLLGQGVEELSEALYGDNVTQEIIHSTDTYDAVLMESYFVQEPVSALLHKFGCVAIEVSSLGDSAWINELAGLPDNTAYQIDWKSTATDSMSFPQRLYNTLVSWWTVVMGYYHLWRKQAVMDKYFNYSGWESRPPIHKLVSNRSVILVNRDLATDYPYPLAPHMKDIGGVNLLPNKPLPKDLQDFMDTANEGVIYFSLGSHLQTSEKMKSEIGKAFLPVFAKLKQKVLMKWESKESTKLPSNVKTYKWMPQQDILAHKNCLMFVTHGGLLSLSEAVYHGVPVLGIPHFADQPKNMAHARQAGYGVQLSLGNITMDSAAWAVQEILHNPRYKEEITRRSKIFRDKRQTALEDAIYWVEYAIKYPNVLTPRAAFLNFMELHMVDIQMVFVLVFVLSYLVLKTTVGMAKKSLASPQKEKVS